MLEGLKTALKGLEKSQPSIAVVMASELAHRGRWSTFQHLDLFTTHIVEWIDFTLQAAEAAGKKAKRRDRHDELLVFSANATRWASHQWTVYNLVQQGRYGECHAIGRMLLEVTDLIVLLASEPEKVTDWVDSTAMPRAPVPRKWQPTAIRRRLERIDAKTYDSSLYSQMSAAVHPSNWGNSMYSARLGGSDNEYAVTPTAIFDPLRALEILGMSLRTAPLPVYQFLRIAQRRNLPAKVLQSFVDRYEQKMIVWALLARFSEELGRLLREHESAAMADSSRVKPSDLETSIEAVWTSLIEEAESRDSWPLETRSSEAEPY